VKEMLKQVALAFALLLGSLSAKSQDAIEYIHTDASGSPIAITNQAGQVIERTTYDPYGSAIGRPNNDRAGYTGHVMDSATGLTYMQQRFYDPLIGRFISTDPVQANPKNGAAFNRYIYALNNPYHSTDPDGRESPRFSNGRPDCGVSGYNLGKNIVSILCGFCDLDYIAPRGSGAVQSVGAPWEMLLPARGIGIGESIAQPAFRVLEQEGSLIIGSFRGANGEARMIAEVTRQGDTLTFSGVHIEGKGTFKEAMQVARNLGEKAKVKRVEILPEKRTTGARPGHTPKPIIIDL